MYFSICYDADQEVTVFQINLTIVSMDGRNMSSCLNFLESWQEITRNPRNH